MRDLLVTFIALGSIPLILRNPWVGVLCFSWLSYMSPHRLAYGFAHDFPFAAIVAGATLVSIFLNKETRNTPVNTLVILWVVWILWMNVTTIFSLIPLDAIIEWKRSMKIQLMALITVMLMQSPQRIKLLVWVIALSIGFFGIKGGVFSLLSGGNYRVWGPPGSFIEGNNPLALALLMILPLLFFLQQNTSNKWIKYGLLIAMPLIALSILTSYSRGAFLAAVAVTIYLILNSRKKIILSVLVIIMAAGGLNFMPEKYFDRINTIKTYEDDGSAMGRINAWYYAYNLAKDRPIVGGGFSAFDPDLFQIYAPEPDDFHDAHSIYFEVLAEQGFVGLGIFLLLGATALRYGSKIKKTTKDINELRWAYDLSSMIQVSIIGYAVGGAFLGLAYYDLYYHLISLIILIKIEVDKVLSPAGSSNNIVSKKSALSNKATNSSSNNPGDTR